VTQRPTSRPALAGDKILGLVRGTRTARTQAPDLLADGGLGDPTPFRCAGEVCLVDDRDELRQLAKFHKQSLSQRA